MVRILWRSLQHYRDGTLSYRVPFVQCPARIGCQVIRLPEDMPLRPIKAMSWHVMQSKHSREFNRDNGRSGKSEGQESVQRMLQDGNGILAC